MIGLYINLKPVISRPQADRASGQDAGRGHCQADDHGPPGGDHEQERGNRQVKCPFLVLSLLSAQEVVPVF